MDIAVMVVDLAAADQCSFHGVRLALIVFWDFSVGT
jgi:hypothetical protein